MITRILPGTSVEVAAGAPAAASGVTGVVTMPLVLSWGAQLTMLEQGADPFATLGYKLGDPRLKLVAEVMQSARKLILYRRNAGTKAAGTLAAGITVTARYGGLRGNDIALTVTPVGERFLIKTFVDTTEVDTQVVADPAGFKANLFVELSGAGELEEATVTLTGGEDGSVGTLEGYFTELEKQEYNLIAYTGTDEAEALSLVNCVKEQRQKDVYVQLVQSVLSANSPAVYHCTVGGKTERYGLTAAEACASIAGILAKQGITGSSTYFDVPWWTDVATRLTKLQQEIKVQNGEVLFVYLHGKVKVLYDINSLTTFTDEQPDYFRKGLVVRTLDQLASDLKALLDQRAIGKIRNSVDGRNQIKGMLTEMIIARYLEPGYIEQFSAGDVTVDPGTEIDAITATVGVKVNDTVDMIYVTVTAL